MSLRARTYTCPPVGVLIKNVPRCTLDDECPICLETLYKESVGTKGESVRKLDGPFEVATNCGHVFHRRCFLSLIVTGQPPVSTQCPSCKTPFDENEIKSARVEAANRPPPDLGTLQRARRPAGSRPRSRQRKLSTPNSMDTNRGYLPSLAMLKR